MPSDCLNPCGSLICEDTSTNRPDTSHQLSGIAIQSSVRDLEQLAGKLRYAGECQAADRVDQMIMSMLDKKIFKKLIIQSRSQKRHVCSIANLVTHTE